MVSMRRKLGQHLIRSERAARSVVDAVSVEGMTVVEIGAGRGALTQHILSKKVPVVAVEKDSSFISFLADRFSDAVAGGSLILFDGDARDGEWLSLVQGVSYVVIANIPYYLTGSLIRFLLTCPHPPSAMSLVVQKEVAERIVARDGKESLLSLSVFLFGAARYVTTFSRRLFSPPPSVDSALLTVMDIHAPSPFVQEVFFEIIHTAFHEKRKAVLKKFSGMPRVRSLLVDLGVTETTRAEDVSRETWVEAARMLSSQ